MDKEDAPNPFWEVHPFKDKITVKLLVFCKAISKTWRILA